MITVNSESRNGRRFGDVKHGEIYIPYELMIPYLAQTAELY